MAWRRPGDKPLSEPMMVSLLTHICSLGLNELTHWSRVTDICVTRLTSIGSDNGLSPGRRQAIIWTNAGILLMGSSGTHFSEILVAIQTFSFKKIRLKMSSGKYLPLYPGLIELTQYGLVTSYGAEYVISWSKRPISQIPECIRQISHNAKFRSRDVHAFLFPNGALWDMVLVHCVICTTTLLALV